MHKATFVLILFFNFCFSQKTNIIIADSTLFNDKEYTSEEIDSIHKKLNIKVGDEIKIIIFFKINEEGSVVIEKIKSPHILFNNVALEIFKKMPKFKPTLNSEGNPISISYKQPIAFIIDKEKKKDRKN